MKSISERVSELRLAMAQKGVSAYIIPGTDPHAGEYIADHWKERVWISGFDGSAGTAVVTTYKAGVWTDSRYFLQGAEQLAGTPFDLMKQGLPETLEIVPWLSKELKKGDKVGVNPQMFSHCAYVAMESEFAKSGLELVQVDLVQDVWTERAALPDTPFFIFDEKYAGCSVKDKLTLIRAEIEKAYANVFVTSALDDIAWMFNIRGKDVAFNPVTISYALVDEKDAILFVDAKKYSESDAEYLKDNGVRVESYEAIYERLNQISTDKSVLLDGNKLNQSLYEAIPTQCAKRVQMSPAFQLKSVKNETEIAGAKRALVKDGVALTRFFKWFENAVGKEKLTELSVTEKLHNFRAEQENFVGDSFGTICGYAGHGAIVHYSANEKSDVEIKSESLLLLDSGGQYFDGTTDITRVIPLGAPTEKQKVDYTLVLKGHISLAMAQYPENTRGSQLDILARKALWDRAWNYGHGTGHGIGHFLNVHEGPQSIRMDENSTTLKTGMITSNEPGIYRANEYGIRIENLVLTVPTEKTEFGQFYGFETLTLCYIDTTLVEKSLLAPEEVAWLNSYHQVVVDKLTPYLSDEESTWLKEKCRAI